MSKFLNISKIPGDDPLPISFLSLRNVIFGGSGAGKTSLGRVIFEEATRAGIPCGVIDLKADWWGLKSSADGKSDGIPVVVFGGEHADLPITEHGGAELAEIVAELRQPFIIDLEQFSKAKQLKFLAPFFDRLYDKNRLPLKLICDEADRYIPQRIFAGQKDANPALCLGAGEDIAKRGRKHGIFPMFISQRNADLNKSVTELCDVAVVFRTSGPNNQKAVDDWFNAKGSLVTDEQREQVMREIASLANGMAYFCCAHPHLSLFRRIQVRLPETFDSSATPEIGKELIQPKKFARIELEKLGERMRVTIEQAKANDPAELRRQLIAEKSRGKELEIKLAKASAIPLAIKAAPETKIKVKEIPMFPDITRAQLKQIIEEFESLIAWGPTIEKIREQFEKYTVNTGKNKNQWAQPPAGMKPQEGHVSLRSFVPSLLKTPAVPHPISPKFGSIVKGAAGAANESSGTLGKCERAILTALAQYPQGRTTSQAGILTGYTEGGMKNALSQLRMNALIERGQPIRITDAGLSALGEWTPLPTGEDLQKYWLEKLGLCERTILNELLKVYPDGLSMDHLCIQTNYTEGGMKNALSRLRTLELMIRGQPMKASPEFFS